ncbi:MAG: serine hydrolase domain-containing protein [Acidobacteriota bacterium]
MPMPNLRLILAAGLLAATSLATPGLCAATAPSGPASGAVVVRGELGAKLDAIVTNAEKQGFHGVVLVAQGGEETLVKGYGVANHTSSTKFSPSTIIQIGSGVKDFTKIAIFQLVERGKLALADPVSKFFPAAPADKRDITIDQLLEHRAGFPLGIGQDSEPLTKPQFLDRLFATKLEFAPGSAEEYSNAGYALLAAIVEQATTEPFDAYVAREICTPAGLVETGFLVPHFDLARVAHGYIGAADHGTMFDQPHSAEGHDWNLRGNGGYLSTVREQLRFYRSLTGNTLLQDPAHRERVLNHQGPVVLAGSDNISFFLFANFPVAGIEVVLATNHADWKAPRLMRQLEPALGVGGPPPGATKSTGKTLPDTGAGRTVAAYFAAFNGGDDAKMQQFFAERSEPNPNSPTPEKRLEMYHRMRGDFGKLTITSVAETTVGIEVAVQGEHGEPARLTFMLQPTEPFKLRGIRVELGN